ncbi:DUF4355 domain-containing protein [Vagococcus fluvialis]|uniref:capsid assembly scaffolding protein Gp46 family protein n=1 Tax=Vagococcus fluvialis TaxID=2738 RepID=UPI00378F3A3A
MKKKHLLPMNLQLFAEPGEGNPDTPPAEQTPEINLDKLTDEQLASIKEKHGFKTDDDVNDIVKSKHQRWQKDLEKEKNKAAELATLSETDRQQALFNEEKEAFEKEKLEFQKEQLNMEKSKQLREVGIPDRWFSRINGETAEEILADIKDFQKQWDEDLEKAVNKRLVQKQTKVGTGAAGMTKAQIMEIKDPVERQKAIAENRNLF